MSNRTALHTFLAFWLLTTIAFGQGVQTGTLRGSVRDEQQLPIPGVSVTVTSPALQGQRHAVTDDRGACTIHDLPPGDYQVRLTRDGFENVEQQTAVAIGGRVEEDITMAAAGRREVVQVVAYEPPALVPSVGGYLTHRDVEALAVPRTLSGIAELSPGLTSVTPNSGQVSINGAFAFDSIFMINGVDVDDNLFGSPQNLFIEDAIQEVQTLTSGITAEYGRFSGGVVNAITRSGGNTLSGSLRLNLSSPAWSTETPFERSRHIEHPTDVNRSYEGTLGGAVKRDRLWFFGAGRWEDITIAQTFPITGVANTEVDENRRGELKFTGTVASGHSLQGGYLNNHTKFNDRPSIPSFSIDPFTNAPAEVPNWFAFTNYRGAFGNRSLVDVQYSERRWTRKAGGTDQRLVESPFLAVSGPAQYNSPYLDLSDPEGRNNRQLAASLFSVLDSAGRHEVKAGYEWFRSQRTGGNSQTATDYVFHADYLTDIEGNPQYDDTGHLIPVFVPGASFVEHYFPQRNGVLNIDTNSLYLQDHWLVAPRWSADIGVRFEKTRSEATGGVVGVDAHTLSPRLAVGYQLRENGDMSLQATYGHYAGRYNENQIGGNSNVGNADELIGVYQGPAGQGRSFAPGFLAANYPTVDGSFPTANVALAPSLTSPTTKEFTTTVRANVGPRAYAEGTYVFRRTSNLIEDVVSKANGTTTVVKSGVTLGTFTNIVFENADIAKRQYQGLLLQARYKVAPNWAVNGHYTVMLEDDGNYEGEAANAPGSVSLIGNYPEAIGVRSYPDGRLQNFQRHKLRIWTTYDRRLGQAGAFGVSGLWRVNSAQVYSLRINAGLTAIQNALLTGYTDAPTSQQVYFGERGSQSFRGYGVADLSVRYEPPLFRSLRPWVKLDVFNALNNQKLIAWNTQIQADPASPVDSFGLPTGYLRGPNFGNGTSNAHYPAPFQGVVGGRTFRLALGLRF